MSNEDDSLFAATAGLAIMAGTANLVFLSGVVNALVKRGVLSEFDLFQSMADEQEFIESLRRHGDPSMAAEVQQAAGWLERLNELLCRRLYGPEHGRSLLGEWRLDPADPCFPQGPANDED